MMKQNLPYYFFNYFLFYILFSAICTVSAQAQLEEKKPELALGISTNAYRGDLGSGYNKWTSAFQISYYFKHQRRFHGGIHAGMGTVTGQNVERSFAGLSPVPTPNRFFSTNFVTVNYGLQFDILSFKHWDFYVSQGFGIIRYNPKDQFDETLQDNFQTRAPNEGYSNVSVILPSYLGITYHFSNGFGFGVQGGFTNTMTDYLDNISQLGKKQGNDNIVSARFYFYAPLR